MGSTLRYSREYVIRDPYIGAERFADLHKFETVIVEDENANAVLKKTIVPAVQKRYPRRKISRAAKPVKPKVHLLTERFTDCEL